MAFDSIKMNEAETVAPATGSHYWGDQDGQPVRFPVTLFDELLASKQTSRLYYPTYTAPSYTYTASKSNFPYRQHTYLMRDGVVCLNTQTSPISTGNLSSGDFWRAEDDTYSVSGTLIVYIEDLELMSDDTQSFAAWGITSNGVSFSPFVGSDGFITAYTVGGGYSRRGQIDLTTLQPYLVQGWNIFTVVATNTTASTFHSLFYVNGDSILDYNTGFASSSTFLNATTTTSGTTYSQSNTNIAMYLCQNKYLTLDEHTAIFSRFKSDHGIA